MKISVIIPVYNVEKYLRECLDSVVGQTVPFDEVILVNDGSSDRSREICEEYCAKNSEIFLINQENLGLSEARNAGLRAATGDYIVFVDSDDFVSKSMVEILREALQDSDVDILYYNSSILREMRIVISDYEYIRTQCRDRQVMAGIEFVEETFPQDYIITACMAAYKRSFLNSRAIVFERGIYYEDRLFSLQTVTEARAVMYISEQLYIRRFRENSIATNHANLKKIRDVIKGQMLEWNYLNAQPVWTERPCLKRYYIFCGALMALSKEVCGGEGTEAEKEIYIRKLLSCWSREMISAHLSLSEAYILLIIFHEINRLKNKDELLKTYFGGEREYESICKSGRRALQSAVVQKLQLLPFASKEKKIGIYGTGNHSISMTALYEQYVGAICADLSFISSEKNGETLFLGKPVRPVEEIPEDMDSIVISSMIYQKELSAKLKKNHIPDEKIITLYSAHDMIDLVAAGKMLKG